MESRKRTCGKNWTDSINCNRKKCNGMTLQVKVIKDRLLILYAIVICNYLRLRLGLLEDEMKCWEMRAMSLQIEK